MTPDTGSKYNACQHAQNEGDWHDIQIYKKGRRCSKPLCKNKLSIYNQGPFCNVHYTYGAKLLLRVIDEKILTQARKHTAMRKKAREEEKEDAA